MGIRENASTYFVNAPKDALAVIHLPEIKIAKTMKGDFDYIHLFAKTQAEKTEMFPRLKEHLTSDAMLWVSWPKGGQLDTELNLSTVIKIGYGFGLVESTCLSVNEIWSALKFTHPKKGKMYHNSHAKLQSRTTSR